MTFQQYALTRGDTRRIASTPSTTAASATTRHQDPRGDRGRLTIDDDDDYDHDDDDDDVDDDLLEVATSQSEATTMNAVCHAATRVTEIHRACAILPRCALLSLSLQLPRLLGGTNSHSVALSTEQAHRWLPATRLAIETVPSISNDTSTRPDVTNVLAYYQPYSFVIDEFVENRERYQPNMKFVGIILVAILVFGESFASIETEDGVLVITKDNFEKALEEHQYILFEFCKYFYCYIRRIYLLTGLSCCFGPT